MRKILRAVLPDALILAGGGAVVYGVGRIYQPLGWIVGGLMLLVVGFFAAYIVLAAKKGKAPS